MIEFDGCPHCRGVRFLAGPRGGSSQNVSCMGCGARLNLVTPPLPGPLLLLEELSGPTGQPPDTASANYIIELTRDTGEVRLFLSPDELVGLVACVGIAINKGLGRQPGEHEAALGRLSPEVTDGLVDKLTAAMWKAVDDYDHSRA